jgi:HEAT repeat protein
MITKTIQFALLLLASGTLFPSALIAEDEKPLIKILTSDAPKAEKAITCKKLAVFGSKDAVPALSPLLEDEQLCSWARIALEAIPGEEASTALRDALAKVEGRQLIGVINSLAVRQDPAAVEPLTALLESKDEIVAATAAVAIGHIGTEAAKAPLTTALSADSDSLKNAAAEGCILLAEAELAAGKNVAAFDIYQQVRAADVPQQRVLEAVRGSILALGDNGMELLTEQLNSDDKRFFYLGLQTARELKGEKVTAALASVITATSPERGALLLTAIGDRGEPVSAEVIASALSSEEKPLRIAALGVVAKLGTADSVPSLIKVAGESDEELSAAAVQALTNLSGDDVNAAIASRLESANETELAVLIPVVGARRIDATPALTKALNSDNANLRATALAALGETVSPENMNILVKQVTEAKSDEARAAAKKALQTAAIRMPDAEATAEQLVAAMQDQPIPTQLSLLDVVAATGGQTSLAALGKAAKSTDETLQDAGTRLLGEWLSVDAGPTLLEIAKIDGHKFQVRAIRGYIRLARQFAKTDAQRAEMCSKALAAATRPTEQRLVLETARGYPSLPMLEVAIEAADSEELKEEATTTALLIAQKLDGGKEDARKLLAKIGQESVKLEIVEAKYGSGDEQIDVTEIISKQAGDLPLITLSHSSFNQTFGVDPAPGQVKRLLVKYKINGTAGNAEFAEDGVIYLPTPN